MRKPFAILALTGVVLTCATLAACGSAGDPSTHGALPAAIVGGQATTGSPTTVSVGDFCSGTLISPRVVLTAAHCLEGLWVSDVEVFFGSDVNGEGTWIHAMAVETNPDTDIAAVALVAPGPVAPVPAFGGGPGGGLETLLGQPVHIVGFGVTTDEGMDFGLKHEIMATLTGVMDDEMVTTPAPQGTCYGDSGGPNYMTIGGVGYVVGVTSHASATCGTGENHSIRTDTHIEWINAFIATHDGDDGGGEGSGCSATGTHGGGAADALPFVLLLVFGVVPSRRRRVS